MMPRKFFIANKKELENIPMKRFEINGRFILLSLVKDTYYATDDACTHEDVSLADGTLEDKIVTCPKHGAKFDISTGETKALPAILPLKTYAVEIEGDNIYIILENTDDQS